MKIICYPFVLLLSFLFPFTNHAQSTWTAIATPAPDSSGSLMLLLSDGSVLCKTNEGGGDRIGNQWNKLTPNANGSYINGTWSKVCPMKDTRLYFSSQILKNGNIYLAGGEYGTGITLGEVYNPSTNSWVQLPNTNNTLSDASSAILPDGKVLQGSLSSPGNKTLIFNPTTNTYSNGPNCLGGHNESTWLKLPDNSILFIDINSTNSERYIPSLNQWIADANVPVNLYDPYGFETGPGFMLPDGRAFFIGSLGNTAYYTPSGSNSPGTWSVGPTVPNNHGMPDAPGSMMVDGKIVFSAGPKPIGNGAANIFIAPTYFYEFDYLTNTFTQINAPGGGLSVADTAFNTNMLTLPDGSVMYSRLMQKTYYVKKTNGLPLAAGKPTVSTVSQNGCNNTFSVTGLLFNGISEGSCYGDDWQMNTNFPIVRLSNGSNVYYARTYNWNHNGVRNYTLPDSVLFELPQGISPGTYSLSVIANGIASSPVTFTFNTFPTLTSPVFLPDLCTGNTFSYAASVNPSNANVLWTRPAVAGISNAAITSPQTGYPNETLNNTTGISKTAVYIYTLTNGACTNNYSVSVVIHPSQNINVTGLTTICEKAQTTLKLKGAVSYTWNNSVVSNSFIVSPSVTTVYSVSAIDANACPATKQITVTVNQLPTLSLSISGSTMICPGETVTITVNGNASNFYWPLTGQTTSVIAVSPTIATLYKVTGISAFGCQKTDSVRIKVSGPCAGFSENTLFGTHTAIYPNPFNDSFNIETNISRDGMYSLKILDMFGRTLKSENLILRGGKNISSVKMDEILPGVYFIILSGSEGNFKSKLIKEN